MEEFLASLTEWQRLTYLDIEAQKESIRLSNNCIKVLQEACDHDFMHMSAWERDQECRVCGLDKSMHDWLISQGYTEEFGDLSTL